MPLRYGRPTDSDDAAAQFDLDMAHSAKALNENAAFRVIITDMTTLREQFVQALVAGHDGAPEFRKAIQVIDRLIRIQNHLIAAGSAASQWIGDIDNG